MLRCSRIRGEGCRSRTLPPHRPASGRAAVDWGAPTMVATPSAARELAERPPRYPVRRSQPPGSSEEAEGAPLEGGCKSRG
ncbi:MAG: hypothetical protein WKH64_06215 [Chloroflexia bacterium]